MVGFAIARADSILPAPPLPLLSLLPLLFPIAVPVTLRLRELRREVGLAEAERPRAKACAQGARSLRLALDAHPKAHGHEGRTHRL